MEVDSVSLFEFEENNKNNSLSKDYSRFTVSSSILLLKQTRHTFFSKKFYESKWWKIK